MKLFELTLNKNSWTVLVSQHDKADAAKDLIGLVGNAYNNTHLGGFVKSIKDVLPSDWHVIDWDPDPDIDACVFYRRPRANENWTGFKIQGIGHDGQRISKDRAISRLVELLNKPGIWIETSDALRHILTRYAAPRVTDQNTLRALFNDPNLKMIDSHTYLRTLPDGSEIQETVFGNPEISTGKYY